MKQQVLLASLKLTEERSGQAGRDHMQGSFQSMTRADLWGLQVETQPTTHHRARVRPSTAPHSCLLPAVWAQLQ